jgi:hypothetical protein
MKLVMTLLVSDEDELVEPNLVYHLAQGVDFVIVTANRASPQSVATVQRYVEQGVAALICEDAQTSELAEWMTRMARLAATEHAADWVLNADCDEFYMAEAGTLKQVFSAVPAEYNGLTIPINHFPPTRAEDGCFAERMIVREVATMKKPHRLNQQDSANQLMTKVAHRGARTIRVSRGSHRVSGIAVKLVPAWRPIVGLHFPLRSYAQFERKTIKDGHAVANNPDPKVAVSQKRDLYELYESGDLRSYYEARVLDETKVRAGIREGRLVVDDRLRRFFRSRKVLDIDAGGAASSATSDEALQVEALQNEMNRVIYKSRWDPLNVEVEQLKALLDRSERMLSKSTRNLDLAKRRAAEVEALKLRIDKLQRTLDTSIRESEQVKHRLTEVDEVASSLDGVQQGLRVATRRLEEAERKVEESDRRLEEAERKVEESDRRHTKRTAKLIKRLQRAETREAEVRAELDNIWSRRIRRAIAAVLGPRDTSRTTASSRSLASSHSPDLADRAPHGSESKR